ncbi:MAG: TIGR01777 family oxidoreductase [Trueperaceae bacterium]|nr:TIGR01777 family oxidoreductase [Trueperaceae bacterium]
MTRPFIVIAGASGVVGNHLVKAARASYHIKVLTRSINGSEPEGTEPISWKPEAAFKQDQQELERLAEVLSGARAVVNLAGASISKGRFDEAHKSRVLNSRINSTKTLVTAALKSQESPAMWLQASAVGYYGDRGEEELTEDARPQNDFFLSETALAWENAAQPVGEKCRLVTARLGLVLAKDAPAWQQMLLPIKLFVGGPLGSGKQWYPWIDADDLANALLYLMANSSSQGVYNLTAPEPVRQLDLARKAASKLGRPAFVPAPRFALRLLLGGLADMLLLPSTRAVPEKLLKEDFHFDYPNIEAELEHLLGK